MVAIDYDTVSRLNRASRAPAAEGQQMGQVVMRRIVAREQAELQARVLAGLNRLPLGRYLTLCGGAALHGVYLHGRQSKGLDFFGPHIVVMRFRELARGLDLDLRPGPTANTFLIAAPGTFFPEVQVGLRIRTRADHRTLPAPGIFQTPSGKQVPVRALSLAELLAIKLGLLAGRQRPLDYVDFWMGLRSGSETLQEVKAILDDPAWSSGTYAPTRPFNAARAVRGLRGRGRRWVKSLADDLHPVPPFEQVRRDLEAWLPRFNCT